MKMSHTRAPALMAEITRSRLSVFIVINADVKNGVPKIPPFVTSQGESLRAAGWNVSFGIIDNRILSSKVSKKLLVDTGSYKLLLNFLKIDTLWPQRL
jgi:hypothetical protein